LDFLIEMANDPNREAQAERLTLDLKELLVAICEKGSLQTLNALSFLNKICRDRADPIQAHSIYKQFSDVIAMFLPSIIKEDPDAPIVDESLFIASQILTRRLTQCVFGNTLSDVRLWSYLGGTWDFVKTFYSNRNVVVLLNGINVRRADQTSSIENVALRTQMLWQGLIGGASDLTAAIGMGNVLDKWTEKIVMRPNLDKKKAAHLIVAWGSLLDWMRRIHKLGDSAQFIECWRKAIQTCIAGRLKKEKKQALLGNALSIIADYIIVEKDNLEDIILCLRNLSKGTSEMVGIVGELKAVMVEHLKRVGNEDLLKHFVRKT
jgi:F0F1-type ATP synthase membrane subunit c/vacuolar-type H+-ATPase subunit K